MANETEFKLSTINLQSQRRRTGRAGIKEEPMRSVVTAARSIVPILFALSALVVGSVVPVEAGIVSFEAVESLSACDTVTLDVLIDEDVADLRGFSFVFEFDPSIVTPISVEPGAAVEGASCPNFVTWPNASAIGDSIWVDGVLLGCSIDGPGSIIRIRFVGVADGVSPISCRSGALRDSQNQEIPFTCVPGSIEIECDTATEPMHWGRIKTLYL